MLRRSPEPNVSRLLAAIFALSIAVPAALFVVPLWPTGSGLIAGDRAPSDLVALRDAQFESEVLTERARDERAALVEPALQPIDPNVRTVQMASLDAMFVALRDVRGRTDLTSQASRLAALEAMPEMGSLSTAGRTALLALSDDRFDATAAAVRLGLSALLTHGVRKSDAIPRLVDDYIDGLSSRPQAAGELSALREPLVAFLAVNTEIDEVRTEQLRNDARNNVAPVIVRYTGGQVIATEGSPLTLENIEALRETGVIKSALNLEDMGAGALVAGAVALLFGVYVYRLQPAPAPAFRRLLLISVATLLVLGAVRALVPPNLPDADQHYYAFMVPVAAASMIAASYTDARFGAVTAVGVGLFAAFIVLTAPEIAGASFVSSAESLELGIVYVGSGLAGVAAIQHAERFGRYAATAFWVGAVTAALLLAFWFLDEPRNTSALPWLAGVSVGVGAASAVITLGFYLLFSRAFGITTRLQLMELTQSNSPLLRRLQDEAPGTFHHSMMVGALAERAAEQIGADALVTRVGAYYHDVGKLAQPRYYIENLIDGQPSPHDDLTPVESARLILDHVTNGVALARKHRLPEVVRDFIPQHHGTRLVTFFYRRAVNVGEHADPAAYGYPGPRPRTKESAIVMLADSCEAVVRASNDRGPDQVSAVVDAIFAERLAEGQLDDCDITMRELQVVAASFKATLRAVYHQRIEYPAPTSGEPAAARSVGSSAAGV